MKDKTYTTNLNVSEQFNDDVMKGENIMLKMKNEIINELRKMFNDNYKIENIKTFKNGEHMDAIVIKNTTVKKDVTPCFYLNNYINDYNNGIILASEIAFNIKEEYIKSTNENLLKYNDFENYNKQKDNITFRLVNTEIWKEQLNEIPHFEFFDLSIIFYGEVNINEENIGYYLITNKFLEIWNIDKEELIKKARENAPKKTPITIFTLQDAIFGIEQENLTIKEQIEKISNNDIIVITNKNKHYGFSSILYKNILDEIAEKIGSFNILPSSVHEGLIVPINLIDNKEELKSTVKYVNTNVVDNQDLLGDTIYYYNKDTKEIKAY